MTIEACDFKGKKIIVRVDFNVPLDENGKVTESVIMMSHMGKPKAKSIPNFHYPKLSPTFPNV